MEWECVVEGVERGHLGRQRFTKRYNGDMDRTNKRMNGTHGILLLK